jgi:hypothetical protein
LKMSAVMQKVREGIDLVEDRQGRVYTDPELATASLSKRHRVSLSPVTNFTSGNVDAQTLRWRINPGEIPAAKLEDVDLVLHFAASNTGTPGDQVQPFPTYMCIQNIRVYVGGSEASPAQHQTDLSLLAEYGSLYDDDEMQTFCQEGLIGNSTHQDFRSVNTIDQATSRILRLPLHTSLLKSLPIDSLKQDVIVVVTMKSQADCTFTNITSVLEWGSQGCKLEITYDTDDHKRAQMKKALMNKKLVIPYSTTVPIRRTVTAALDTTFSVNLPQNDGHTSQMFISLRADPTGGNATAFQHIGQVTDPDTRVDLRDSSGTSVIGGPIHPSLLRSDNRYARPWGWRTVGGLAGLIPIAFCDNPAKSMAGKTDGYYQLSSNCTLHFLSPSIAAATYTVDVELQQSAELILQNGEFIKTL